MRRDPRIINLYDRPLYSRSCFPAHRYRAPTSNGAPVLASVAIVTFVSIFFWAYGAIAHREPLHIPLLTETGASERRAAYQPAPAPDMRSEAVAFANADAPKNTKPLQIETKDDSPAVAIAPQSRSAVAQNAAKPPVSEAPGHGARAFASTSVFDRIRVHGF
jgi:hypothetical protein